MVMMVMMTMMVIMMMMMMMMIIVMIIFCYILLHFQNSYSYNLQITSVANVKNII